MGGVVTGEIAVACSRASQGGEPDALYPDPDAAPLQAALAELGASSRLIAWDDPGADWTSFSMVVVSSTWDSVDRPAEYLAWVRTVSRESDLINPPAILEWNIDKVYLRELERVGVPVIPTTWVAPGDAWAEFPASEFVVKPAVSAGGRSTARYSPGDPAGRAHVQTLQNAGQTVMVQDYLLGIDIDGETDLIFIDGKFSHAVLKRPVLRTGDGIIERPWERMAWAGLVEPDTAQFRVAQQTMDVLTARFGQCPVYSRIDLVPDSSGAPVLLEVELIDPYLSLDMEPVGASRLASALV